MAPVALRGPVALRVLVARQALTAPMAPVALRGPVVQEEFRAIEQLMFKPELLTNWH
jgi:hypothetical protein